MRQRAKRQIESEGPPVGLLDGRERWQRVRGELRKDIRHRLAGAAIGGKQHDLDARMADQQPQQLGAGIAGGTEDSDLGFLLYGHDRPLGLRKAQADSAGTVSREACRGTGGTRIARRLRASACRGATAAALCDGNGHKPSVHGRRYKARSERRQCGHQCAEVLPPKWHSRP
jgi:hypothetical protein